MRNNSANRILLTALETAINAYLRLDPDHEKQLAALRGNTVGIILGSFGITDGVSSRRNTEIYFTVTAGGIRVHEQAPAPADAIIRTPSPLTLLQLIRSQHFTEETTIDGDSDVARRWQTLLRDIDIDWEEHLSRIVGDVAAHQLANTARASLNWGRNTANTLLQNMSEYLQYEHNDLPSRYVIERFLDAVDTLQADTERLAARIERLQRICSNASAPNGVSAKGVSPQRNTERRNTL